MTNNLTKEEFEMLGNCSSLEEWNTVINAIKAARNDQYPSDWWPKMIQSGRAYRIVKKFGRTTYN